MSTPSGPPTDGRSRHLVDPDLDALVEGFLPDGIHAGNLEQARADRVRLVAEAPPPPEDGVRREAVEIPGPERGTTVPLVVHVPPGPGPHPLLLHVHGGGHVVGLAAQNDADNRRLAREVGCVVASVDYRLAPEAPYPAGLEDCYAALTWLHEHPDRLDVDPGRVAVKGESAGGGLAAALALLTRDRGGPPLVLQYLIYPMLDDRTVTTDDPHPYAGEFVWDAGSNRFGWTSLLGPDLEVGGPDVPAYAAPARASDLTGLPPTFMALGALDLFGSEDLAYADRLTRAGVPLELHVYPGAVHGFYNDPGAAVTQQALRDGDAALRKAFGPI